MHPARGPVQVPNVECIKSRSVDNVTVGRRGRGSWVSLLYRYWNTGVCVCGPRSVVKVGISVCHRCDSKIDWITPDVEQTSGQ